MSVTWLSQVFQKDESHRDSFYWNDRAMSILRYHRCAFVSNLVLTIVMRVARANESVTPRLRAIAFHLPQFHPIPENDEWWEKGFTEWTNVVKATPLFPRHYQPHLPADLGFYDLRLPEARAAQAELAASYGIHGFCYYHYWFNGRRLLGRPLDEILASGQPDFPFCLCWANESWTRGWLGRAEQVLIAQTYNPDDELRHAHWLAKVFADSRYLRKDGRAIFLIYRPGDLPEPKRLTETMRAACNNNGDKDPYLIGVDAHHVTRFPRCCPI